MTPMAFGDISHSQIDKEKYIQGEYIKFSGTVDDPSGDIPVSIIIRTSNGDITLIAQTTPDIYGNFEMSFVAGGSVWNTEGVYSITAQHDSMRIVQHEFMFVFEEQELIESESSNVTKQLPVDTPQKQLIPEWIRVNAQWWAGDQIDDATFISGIQFLINEGILAVPETNSSSSQDTSVDIPTWIKNNADWWSQGLISDDDFLKGIQYLVGQEIIIVHNNSVSEELDYDLNETDSDFILSETKSTIKELEKPLITHCNSEPSPKVDLHGCDLSDMDLHDTNLSGANLKDADLSNTYLSGIDLSNAILSGADLSNAIIPHAILSGADLSNADLSNTNLPSANLIFADLSGADLKNVNLSFADLSGADISDASMKNVDLTAANLSETNLENAELLNTSLRDADLSYANLSGANIWRVNLSGANLENIEMSFGFFSFSNLTDVNLIDANISEVNFQDAILTNTILTNTHLEGIWNLPISIEEAVERGAIVDDMTYYRSGPCTDPDVRNESISRCN